VGSGFGGGGAWDARSGRDLLASVALTALLVTLPVGSALAAEQYERGPKVATGVFLTTAPEPKTEPSRRRSPRPAKARRSVERQATPASEQRIVGGNTTTIEEWPWQAAITADREFYLGSGFDRQFCGGSLVAPTIVVSAAHCFYDVLEGGHDFDPADLFAAITGRTQLSSSTGQEIEVRNLYFFVDGSGKPLYKPNTNEWDVIFAELASPSPSSNSAPIQIAGASEAAAWAPADENAWATGWGTTSSGGSRSDTLREVNIDRIADSICGSSSTYGSDFDPETMVCAGEMLGGQDTCQGDSGGPLVTPIGGGTFRLIGDTSWGFGCALPNRPGVYGRVAEDPMCSALQGGIQTVAGMNVVGPGGCLGGVAPPPPPPGDPAQPPDGTTPPDGATPPPDGATPPDGTTPPNGTVAPPTLAEFPRTLSLAYSEKKKKFRGRLGSAPADCISDQKVSVFEKEKGKDPKLGSDSANEKGKYSLKEKGPKGRFYARVKPTSSPDGICLAAKSETIKVG
jgi:hypothetical protein